MKTSYKHIANVVRHEGVRADWCKLIGAADALVAACQEVTDWADQNPGNVGHANQAGHILACRRALAALHEGVTAAQYMRAIPAPRRTKS